MKHWFFLWLSLTLIPHFTVSQVPDQEVVSPDHLREINTLLESSREFESTNLDSALLFARSALSEARKLGHDPIVASASLRTGAILHALGNWSEAHAQYAIVLQTRSQNQWHLELLQASLTLRNPSSTLVQHT